MGATTPRVWSRLFVQDSANLLHTGLVRSKHCPVDVVVVGAQVFPRAVDLLLLRASHLRTLRMDATPRSYGPRLCSFVQERFPVLQELQAYMEKARVVSPAEEIGQFRPSQAPQLTYLLFDGIQLSPSSPILGQLRRLDLSH